jgi:hypothetical protein
MDLRASDLEPRAPETDAHFTYSMTPTRVFIRDFGTGSKIVKDDLKAVLKKIEFWHQGSIAEFEIIVEEA